MLDPDFFDRYFPDEEPEGESWDEEYVYEDEDIYLYDTFIDGDLRKSPSFQLGMWKKIVLNYINFKDQIVDFFKQTESGLNDEELSEAGQVIAFNRGWNYIQNLNLLDSDVDKSIFLSVDDDFTFTLKMGIKHFESYEEYERCAFLLKILKKVEKFSL